jgi:hypothetical protein
MIMTKPHSDSFAEKISPDQKKRLIEWLSEHSYSETAQLVAADPPEGFGLQISNSTLCRFHKANYEAIAELRQEKLNLRAAEQQLYSEGHNDLYRSNLNKGTTLCLQERLYEFLTRPVESIDDLKKLVYICRQVKDLRIPLDPKQEIARETSLLLAQAFNALQKPSPPIASDSSPS